MDMIRYKEDLIPPDNLHSASFKINSSCKDLNIYLDTYFSKFANIIMHFSTDLIAFVAASLVASSIAAPVENTILVGQRKPSTPAGPLKCTDPKTGTDPKCWNELKVDEYLEKWHHLNFPATCKNSTEWSTCFNLFVGPGNGPQNCTTTNYEQCQKLDPAEHYLSPQWYYGSYNSWSINQFFSGWVKAIRSVAKGEPSFLQEAAEPEGVDEFLAAKNLDKTVSIDLVLGNLITRAKSDPQNDALRAVLKTFKPNSYKLGDKTKSAKPDPLLPFLLEKRLNETLYHVESNMTSFLAMATNGRFSKPAYTEREDLICDWGFCVKLDETTTEPFDG
ncbi:MAG: hypothetical protein Q9226_002040 [Calogaya cf. arnoldii]